MGHSRAPRRSNRTQTAVSVGSTPDIAVTSGEPIDIDSLRTHSEGAVPLRTHSKRPPGPGVVWSRPSVRLGESQSRRRSPSW